MLRYKKFLIDIFINLFSNSLVLVVIQLLIFPSISHSYSSTDFGIVVAIYGINNVINIFLGNTLNNLKLIDKEEKYDFSGLCFWSNILSAVFIAGSYFIYYKKIIVSELLLLCLFTILVNFRSFLNSYYRISLEYNKLLYENIYISAGYLLGLLLFKSTELSWLMIFLTGEFFGYLYIFKSKNPLIKDGFFWTQRKKIDSKLLREFLPLSFSNALSSSLNYFDRIAVIPLLGSTSMSVFYAASSVSKIITMLITPMSNVMLSYVVGDNKVFTRRKFLYIYFFSIIVCVPVYFILNIISSWVSKFLYPDLFVESSKIISIITVGILLTSIYSLINPFLLKQYELSSQMFIQVVYGITYIILAILLSKKYGLSGFCYAYSISSIVKIVTQFAIVSFGRQKVSAQ